MDQIVPVPRPCPRLAWSAARPLGSKHISVAGREPHRIVAFGSVFSGRGVVERTASFGGRLAHGIARATGRGVELEERERFVRSGAEARPVSFIPVGVQGADVLVLHVDDLLDWAGNVDSAAAAQVRALQTAAPDQALLVLTTMNPSVPVQLRRFAAGISPNCIMVQLPAPTAVAADTYALWGGLVAERAGGRLALPTSLRSGRPVGGPMPSARPAAPNLRDEAWEEALQLLLQIAREVYAADAASIELFGETPGRYTVGEIGFSAAEQLAAGTRELLRRRDAVLVPDVHSRPAHGGLSAVTSAGIRFYAGFRLVDANGARMGGVTVASAAPRPEGSMSIGPLRDLARLVEGVMWRRGWARAAGLTPARWL